MMAVAVIAKWEGVRVADRYETVGEFIRARRRLLNKMSQDQLAELIERDQTFVSQMELNATDGYLPPREMVRSLARALQCQQADLLRAAGYLDDDPDVQSEGMTLYRLHETKRELAGIRDQLTRVVQQIESEFPNITNGGNRG